MQGAIIHGNSGPVRGALAPRHQLKLVGTPVRYGRISTGGMVAGVSEFAAQVRDATALKPVIAYVSPHAPEVGALLTQRGVPAFAAAERNSLGERAGRAG